MLQINGLTIGHSSASKLALQPFSLATGEQCLLTGKSGTGKTTLLLTCAGLMRPLAGEVSVNDQNIHAMSESKRDPFRGTHIGLVFQTLHLMPLLSVEDNLKLVFYAAGLPIHNDRMNHVLERLGLDALRRRLPHTLSQGQAQRLCIARAVVHLPKLILADEPTSSLDDENCKIVMLLLQELAREANAALLVSTHDSRIKKYFSRIISLDELRA